MGWSGLGWLAGPRLRRAVGGGRGWSRGVGVVVVGLVVGLVGFLGVDRVEAAPGVPGAPDPSWYFDETGIAEVVEAGFDGEGVTIAVIDGWIDTSLPVFSDADIEVRSLCGYPPGVPGFPSGVEVSGEVRASDLPKSIEGQRMAGPLMHGTSVTARLVGNGALVNGVPGPKGVAPKAKVIHFVTDGWSMVDEDGNIVNHTECPRYEGGPQSYAEVEAMTEAVAAGADIISWSSAGWIMTPIADQIAAGEVIAVQGMRNSLYESSAGSLVPGVVSPRGFGADGELMAGLDFPDSGTTVVAPGGDHGAILEPEPGVGWRVVAGAGNSFATPVLAGILADLKTKYPQAGNGQILQSLVRNTWGKAHKPAAGDMWGWGPVEVPFLFSVDPTQYPDVNPLLGARGTLTVEQPEVEASGSPSPKASPSETGGPVAAGNQSGSRLWLVVGLVGVIVATVVVVVVVLVVSSRSKRKGYGRG